LLENGGGSRWLRVKSENSRVAISEQVEQEAGRQQQETET